MESSSSLFSASQLPLFCLKPLGYRGGGHSFHPLKKPRHSSSRLFIRNCQKMYVPGFGEASPEAKAANNLHNFFTYVAVRIVTAQLEAESELQARKSEILSVKLAIVRLREQRCLNPDRRIASEMCRISALRSQLKGLDNKYRARARESIWVRTQSYNEEAYRDMVEFMENHSLNDGDKFIAELMRESPVHQNLALRILEVRTAYCKNDFEWDNLKGLAIKMVGERNTRLMKDYVTETTKAET